MNVLLNEEIMVALALPLSVAVAQISHLAYTRLRTYAVARCVWHMSNMITAEEEPSDEEMRALRLRFSAGVMLDAVIFIAEKVYGDALNRLALIVEVCDVDYHVIKRIRGGKHRICYLSKLSMLPYATLIAENAEEYIDEECRDTRFYAMAALVLARPDRAVRYIAGFTESLSLYEVALLVQLMRRAGVHIAYTPLLSSQNRNLQMLGIYLSGHFSIADAEPHLQRLAESEDKEVSYLALQTLCSIRGNISTVQVRNGLHRLSSHERYSFLLHAVQNCYSLRSCAHALTNEERKGFAQRINSYKCRMVCN